MALTHADAQSIIDAEARNKVTSARSANISAPRKELTRPLQVTIFVGYMRRYATAFEVAKKEIQSIKKIDYVRVRDIIGFVSSFASASQRIITDTPSSSEPLLRRPMWLLPGQVYRLPRRIQRRPSRPRREDRSSRSRGAHQESSQQGSVPPVGWIGLARPIGHEGAHWPAEELLCRLSPFLGALPHRYV